MGSVNLWSCRNAGSLSAPLRGSTAAAAWPRIGSASTERPWRSCVSPQSASCSENSAIRPEVSGQTLRLWPDLPRDVQELLFETAVPTDPTIRNRLAVFLHDRHPRTAHPPKPTQLG